MRHVMRVASVFRLSWLHVVRRSLLVAVGCSLAGGLSASVARAHGDIHAQLEAISAQLWSAPSATLYLKRGELQRAHAAYDEALADYARAAELEPELDAILLSRGRTLFEAGRLPEARAALDPFIARQPVHAEARMIRARVQAALKNYEAAVADFDCNLALSPAPIPECVLERAAALVALGQKETALQGIDEGIALIGNLQTLQTQAIEIEIALGRHDSALSRIDRVLANLQRKETWLTRRAEILAAAGRQAEAQRTYAEALAAIDLLPPRHREAKPTRELEMHLRAMLARNFPPAS